jgi:UDPglucose 6-dehydrogenase
MKIGIVGIGHVGTAMHRIFPCAAVYDKHKEMGTREEINSCDIAFVCVPTPMNADGSCDTSAVDETLSWLESETIVVRSTIPVGYIDAQTEKTGKQLVFQPEYFGETAAHPFADLAERQWITLGGSQKAVDCAVRAYQTVYNSDVIINIVDAKTAELAKYMENAFYALKVTFCNEFYDIAEACGVDYHRLRDTWLLDPRIGRSHTFVYTDNRGFGGSCLPKDLAAIRSQARDFGVNSTLLDAVSRKNEVYHPPK